MPLFFYISVQKQYDTYNSILYVINYYYPYGYLQCYNNAVGEPNIIIALEFFYCKLKQGHALTIKEAVTGFLLPVAASGLAFTRSSLLSAGLKDPDR